MRVGLRAVGFFGVFPVRSRRHELFGEPPTQIPQVQVLSIEQVINKAMAMLYHLQEAKTKRTPAEVYTELRTMASQASLEPALKANWNLKHWAGTPMRGDEVRQPFRFQFAFALSHFPYISKNSLTTLCQRTSTSGLGGATVHGSLAKSLVCGMDISISRSSGGVAATVEVAFVEVVLGRGEQVHVLHDRPEQRVVFQH